MDNENKKKLLWITRTAIFVALLIVTQVTTVPLGNTLVTGTLVNMLLIVCVMTGGLASGITVALISPLMAKLLGIGPLWSLIPFIAAGNTTLVLIWNFLGNRNMGRKIFAYIVALIAAAAGKFLILYLGIVQIAVPVFLGLPEKQAAVISNMFSIPQLFHAMIGGALATALLPVLKKAIRAGVTLDPDAPR